eukprot:TRINITY_DN17039_c0_g1_i5.p1 TRINITY_DN17039_c0_g1~~TRINITY_DN17039_c0_g1_i5.p1  ORF type:complete len:397 (-),score=69.26 TRINITY_DN17039_c0_g1_i5:52-1242(-)
MIRRPPRSTQGVSSAASDVYKRQSKNYINVVMQCLFATRPLVNSYLNLRNEIWVNTAFNRRLKEFFQAYRDATSAFDPLPFIEEALLLENKMFRYQVETDPMEILKQLLHAYVFSQSKISRKLKSKTPQESVRLSETLIGRLFSSIVCSSTTCVGCQQREWARQEVHNFRVPFPMAISQTALTGELLYSLEEISGSKYYVPFNSPVESRGDVNGCFIGHFQSKFLSEAQCEVCKAKKLFRVNNFLQTTPEILILQIEKSSLVRRSIVNNLHLCLDNVAMINQKQFISPEMEQTVSSLKATEAPLGLVEYTLYAFITQKISDVLTGIFHAAYVRLNGKWYYTRDEITKEVTDREVLALSLIHISEPTRPLYISYAVFCLKKKKKKQKTENKHTHKTN